MKSYSSKDLISLLESNGWYLKESKGSHHHFIHSEKPGKISIPHPRKDIPIGTVKSILKQAEI